MWLNKEYLPILLLSLAILSGVTGCTKVNYSDFIEKPVVSQKDNSLEVKIGFTAASANWVKTRMAVVGNEIHLSGSLTFFEQDPVMQFEIPSKDKCNKVFWIDNDNKKHQLSIRITSCTE